MILVVAATADELRGADPAAAVTCGVGPVEAAARTATALARTRPDAVLHVGIAGGRVFREPVLVVGSEACYADADDDRWIVLREAADRRLVEAARRALPAVRVEPIATSARVGGAVGHEVEAMEGYAVLRAAALAGVPAVEVRALSNAIGEPDRAKWLLTEAKDLLAGALPGLLEELARA